MTSPDRILGPDLMVKIQAQAERFGTEVVLDDVVDLQLDGDVKQVTLGNGEVHEALSVIFATGSAYRKLGIPDEERLSGHGVSWCATCDGFFFRNKTIAVLNVYVELLASGVDPAEHYPGLASHLAACGSCAEEAHGPLAAVRDDDLHI